MTDIFAPMSNNANVGCSLTIMWYIALVPCMDALLIILVVAISSQSNVAWVKQEYCLNSFIKFSSLVDSCFGTLLLISFSFEIMVSMILFMVVSTYLESSGV